MQTRKVHIKSFGCQMNKLDTALVTAALKEAGYELCDAFEEADAVVLNTCSVREHAEEKVFSHLGNLKRIKRNRSGLIVVVMGCMAQRLGEKLAEHEAVDIVCGPGQIPRIVELIENVRSTANKRIEVTPDIRKSNPVNGELEKFECLYDSDDKQIPAQAFVRAMRGCNNFCTYCIVPYVRGPEVSRPPTAIIDQVKRLADEGTKLVTFLGQTVNNYEYKQGEKTWCLSDIMAAASEIKGIEWIRFVTSYPQEKYFDEIIGTIAGLEKVCNYLHMPAQSGSDVILRAMNRHYTSSQYLNLLDRARQAVPNISIAGDFIVGFTGETDDDFNQTAELVRKARYKNCFVFKYSVRPGTTAERRLCDDVPMEVKKQRNIELLSVQEKISREVVADFMDTEVKVLVEGLSKKPHLNKTENNDNPQLIGRTADDWIVVFNGPENLAGNFAKVKIIKTSPLTLFGQMA